MDNQVSTIYHANNEDGKLLGSIISSGHYISTYCKIGDRKINTENFGNERRVENIPTKKQDEHIYKIVHTNQNMKRTIKRTINRQDADLIHFKTVEDNLKN